MTNVIDGAAIKPKKEAAVLSKTSLHHLAKEVRQSDLQLYMLLNIPTVTIVRFKYRNDDNNLDEVELAKKLLIYWKQMRDSAKEKDKVNDLERALRDSNQLELADILIERHRLNMELVPECFHHQ